MQCAVPSARSAVACGCLAALLASPAAWGTDWLAYRAGLSTSSTDNFLRSNAAGNVQSEQTTTGSFGVKVSLPVSRQTFDLDAGLVANQHQKNRNFDYTAQNYQLAWQWAMASRWRGNISSQQSETLNNPSDSTSATLRNKNTKQSSSFQLVYDLGREWQLYAGVVNSRTINERALIGQTDSNSSGAQAGVRVASAQGNSLDLGLQQGRGTSGSDFSYNSATLSGRMALGGRSWLSASVGQTQQRFATNPQFDYDGPSAAINLLWNVSGKTTVNASWQRTSVGYQTSGTTHTRNDTFALTPSWQISSKSALSLTYKETVRSDQGSPNGVSTHRQDTVQDTTLSYRWQAHRSTAMSLGLTDSSRSSNAVAADYHASQVDLAATFTF